MVGSVHFYVTLKSDFLERCSENEGSSLFDNLDNPWLEARRRLTPGRVYPVLGVEQQGRILTILDDTGHEWSAALGLFKFADDGAVC